MAGSHFKIDGAVQGSQITPDLVKPKKEIADVYLRADLVVRFQVCDVRIDELRMPFERQGDRWWPSSTK